MDGDEVSVLLAGGEAPGTQILGNPEASEISFEEFRKLKMKVDEEGRVNFFGTADAGGIPLKAGNTFVTVDRPVRPDSEVT